MTVHHVRLIYSVTLCFVLGGLQGVHGGWTDDPPLTTPAATILELSEATPEDDEYAVTILREQATFSFDDEHRMVREYRLLYRIDQESAVDAWSSISRGWGPWHDERPVLRARTISAAGEVRELDPATIGEYSKDSDDSRVFSDRKTLRAPLPNLHDGTIVDEWHRVVEHAPFFPAGRSRSYRFGSSVPIWKTLVRLEAPESMTFRWKRFLLPELEIDETVVDGRRIIEFRHGRLDPIDRDARNAPGDVPRRRLIAFSTAESWGAVARLYAERVDAAISETDTAGLVPDGIEAAETREQKIGALLESLHARVRYTGVEFGENSIYPVAPAKTLERGFGDCKDKATLLVAMLRESGVLASIALLGTGPGFDTVPGLPGMGWFDHAIVHVPGTPAYWIDATAELAPLGQIPLADQGRWALIAAPDTTELEMIPLTTSTDNGRREVREVHLSRFGEADIVERTESKGSFDLSFRNSFDGLSDDDLRAQIGRYTKRQYGTESLGELSVSDARDFTRPVSIVLRAKKTPKAQTTDSTAWVIINPIAVTRDLPSAVRSKVDEDERELPLELLPPFKNEVRYVIKPPPGFEPVNISEDFELLFGAADYREKYRVGDDGTVTVDLVLDSGPALWTKEQVAASRKAMSEFLASPQRMVRFQHTGESYLQAGRLRDAIEIFHQLAADAPDEPQEQLRIARGYLAAGLGEAAREAARRAVKLDPESMIAQRTLGFVLAHDLLGRKFEQGFDAAGAATALRRALELDPEDFVARGELAILLEFSPDGERYTNPESLDEAIDHYRYVRDELDNEGLTTNLLRALLHARRYQEVFELWPDLPQEAAHGANYLAAIALTKGSAAAVEQASALSNEAQAYRTLLISAAQAAVELREYSLAGELQVAGARGAENSVALLTEAEAYGRIRRHETFDLSRKTPESTLRAFFATCLDSPDRAIEFLPATARKMEPEAVESLVELVGYMSIGIGGADIPRDRALDLVLSLVELASEGSAQLGYRVLARYGAFPDTPFFITGKPGQYELLWIGSDAGTLVGRHLESVVASGNEEAIARWLSWLRAENLTIGDEAQTDPAGRPLVAWFCPGDAACKSADDPKLRLLTQALQTDLPGAAKTVKVLRKVDRSTLDEDALAGLDLALAQAALIAEQFDLATEAAERLYDQYADSTLVYLLLHLAYTRVERFDDAERLSSARLERFPDEALTRSLWIEVPKGRGDRAGYRQRLESVVNGGRATAGEFNNLAWLDIVDDRVNDETLQHALRSVSMVNYPEASSMHTLAAVYAELGQVSESRDVLFGLIEGRPSGDLEAHDWYVLGRLAEQYGVLDAARRFYDRVEPDPDESKSGMATRDLADRRLALMNKAAAEN